jgi:hypothetical protein
VRKDLYDKFVRDGSFYGRRVQSKTKIILENTGTVQHRNNGEFHHQDEQHQHRDLHHKKHSEEDDGQIRSCKDTKSMYYYSYISFTYSKLFL